MLIPEYTSRFKKDLRLAQKRRQNIEALKLVINLLCAETPLPHEYKDHPLTGNWKGHRECHIEPDWLLIYKTGNGIIVFNRTGSHSDLF